jgi:hypothetical protein
VTASVIDRLGERINPVALRDLRLLYRSGNQLKLAHGLTAMLALVLAVVVSLAWASSHPGGFWVRHAPLAVSTLLWIGLVALELGLRVALDPGDRSYESLLLSGASGWVYVSGKLQAGIILSVMLVVQFMPLFAACVAILGTDPVRLAGFLALALANAVLIGAAAIWTSAATRARPVADAAGATAAGQPSTAYSPQHATLVGATLVAGIVPALVVWALALAGRGPESISRWPGGELVKLLMAFSPLSAWMVDRITLPPGDLPYVPFAVALNLLAACCPLARAAGVHAHRRYDTSRLVRGLYLVVFALAIGVAVGAAMSVAPGQRAPGPPALPVAVACCTHLVLLFVLVSPVMAPPWPAAAKADVPGHESLSDLLRERSGTGLAFLLLLDLVAALAYAFAASGLPPDPPSTGIAERFLPLAWLYVVVAGVAWAGANYEHPSAERRPPGGLSVLLVLVATVLGGFIPLWNEIAAAPVPAVLREPMRIAVTALVAANPPLALTLLATECAASPRPLRMLAQSTARTCATSPEGLFWLSLALHAVIALAGLARMRRIRRRTLASPG